MDDNARNEDDVSEMEMRRLRKVVGKTTLEWKKTTTLTLTLSSKWRLASNGFVYLLTK